MKRFQKLIVLLLAISWTLTLSSCSFLGRATLREQLGDELYDELVDTYKVAREELENEIREEIQEGLEDVQQQFTKEGNAEQSFESSKADDFLNYETATVDFSEGETAVDELDGVPAYYRPNSNDDTDTTFSCAAYVKRYYKTINNVDVWNLLPGQAPHAGSGSFSVTEYPQKGDIGSINDGGHWFIIKQVNDDGSCVIIEQNWKKPSSTTVKINRVLNKEDYIAYRWSERAD